MEQSDTENTETVNILGTGMVEAARDEVCRIYYRFCIVSSVGCQHDGRQHGQVGGGEQQGGHEQLVV